MGGIENFVDWTVFRSFLSNFSSALSLYFLSGWYYWFGFETEKDGCGFG